MGISQGGSGLMATPRDMLALLRLVAQGGQWDGQQLLPQDYLQAATAWQIDNAENGGSGGWDFAQGYGYQFWRLTHNAWSMYGMGGQLAICLPDQDMLLVTTADTQPLAGGVQTILDAFWNCLLPGVADAALPANPAAYAELTKKLSTMQLPIVENLAAPDTELCCATVQMGLNAPGLTALQLQENALVLHYGGKTCTLPFRTGALVQSHLWDDPALPCVIAAGWRAPDSLLFRVHLLGERLGSLSLQLKLRPGGATLALCSHEEHPDPDFSGTAEGVTAV